MPGYRLYLLDRYSGHIDGVEELVSADDVGAIALVTERPRDVPLELWCGGRKVCRIDAPPEVSKYGLQADRQLRSDGPSGRGAAALAKWPEIHRRPDPSGTFRRRGNSRCGRGCGVT